MSDRFVHPVSTHFSSWSNMPIMEKLVVMTSSELAELINTSIRMALKELLPNAEVNECEILTHAQASLFLHMSEQTLYGYCHRLEVPYFKGGGDPSRKKAPNLYSKKELTVWQQNGRQLTREQIEALDSLTQLKGKIK